MDVKQILMPFTGKAEEQETLLLVCHLAKALRARLSVVYVLEVPLTLPLDTPDVPGLNEAEQVLERAELIGRKAGMPVSTDIVQVRDAGVGIVEEAETIHADLIVMSGHRNVRHPDNPIGDTIRYVLKHAPCPVWISCAPAAKRPK